MLSPRVLREYALVADGERGALIGPDGSVTWLCVPRWDSPAAFSGLLGGPGRYTITPADPWHVWGGYYEPASLIWRSRWVGDSRIECREALAMPADPRRAVLLRRVEAVDGPAKVTVVLDLRGGYGRGRMTDLVRQGDVWTGRSGRAAVPLVGRRAGAARRRPAPHGGETGGGREARLRSGAQLILTLPRSPPIPTRCGRRRRRPGRRSCLTAMT